MRRTTPPPRPAPGVVAGREKADVSAVLADLAYAGLAFSLSAACCTSLWETATSRTSGWRGAAAQALLTAGRPAAVIGFAACGLLFVAFAGWTAGSMRVTSADGRGEA